MKKNLSLFLTGFIFLTLCFQCSAQEYADRFFSYFDSDSNAFVTEYEYNIRIQPRFRPYEFSQFDGNQDKKINRSELIDGIDNIITQRADDEVNKVLKYFDVDRNRNISSKEFQPRYLPSGFPSFKEIDKDKNNSLTVGEMRKSVIGFMGLSKEQLIKTYYPQLWDDNAKKEVIGGQGKCPEGMISVGSFCIDKYEFISDDEKPMEFVSWYEAQAKCQSIGKRLCDEREWETACSGPYRLRFPYGNDYSALKCNNGGGRAVKGAYPECVSGYGVFDMSGNLWEWTSNKVSTGAVIKGGAWNTPSYQTSCFSGMVSEPNGRADNIGFRCCASLDSSYNQNIREKLEEDPRILAEVNDTYDKNPCIQLLPDSIDIGEFELQKSIEIEFMITNTGDGELLVDNISCGNPAVSIATLGQKALRDEIFGVKVRIYFEKPLESLDEKIYIFSNAVNFPTLALPVKGTLKSGEKEKYDDIQKQKDFQDSVKDNPFYNSEGKEIESTGDVDLNEREGMLDIEIFYIQDKDPVTDSLTEFVNNEFKDKVKVIQRNISHPDNLKLLEEKEKKLGIRDYSDFVLTAGNKYAVGRENIQQSLKNIISSRKLSGISSNAYSNTGREKGKLFRQLQKASVLPSEFQKVIALKFKKQANYFQDYIEKIDHEVLSETAKKIGIVREPALIGLLSEIAKKMPVTDFFSRLIRHFLEDYADPDIVSYPEQISKIKALINSRIQRLKEEEPLQEFQETVPSSKSFSRLNHFRPGSSILLWILFFSGVLLSFHPSNLKLILTFEKNESSNTSHPIVAWITFLINSYLSLMVFFTVVIISFYSFLKDAFFVLKILIPLTGIFTMILWIYGMKKFFSHKKIEIQWYLHGIFFFLHALVGASLCSGMSFTVNQGLAYSMLFSLGGISLPFMSAVLNLIGLFKMMKKKESTFLLVLMINSIAAVLINWTILSIFVN